MTKLREKLQGFGVKGPVDLGKRLKTTRQYADQLWRGRSYGPRAARKIGEAFGLSWREVYSWQDGDR